MNHTATFENLPGDEQQTRLSICGEYGRLRAWLDGCRHPVTKEPTLAVDVVYIDQETKNQKHLQQRGLRATTVASICACICLGEENVTSQLIDQINSQFQLLKTVST